MSEQVPERASSQRSGQGFFGDIMGDLKELIGTLIRKEMMLARNEMASNAKQMGKDAGFLAVGGALAYAGLLAMLAGMVNLLASFLPRWLSAFVVGGTVIGIGTVLIQKGRENLQQAEYMPDRTIESAKQDAEMIKSKVT